MISITQPATIKYCGTHDLFLMDHPEQTRARSPRGPNIFTAKINQLSQSKPKGLPLHRLNPGHEKNTRAKDTSAINSSIQAKILKILSSNSNA